MSELCFIIDRCLASQLVCTVGEKNSIEDTEPSYLSTVNYSGTPDCGGKPAGSVLCSARAVELKLGHSVCMRIAILCPASAVVEEY